jgi:prevent-host-death family protein
MKTVPVYEAKTKFSELLVAVEHGEQVTITRRGRPVARLVAADEAAQPHEAQRERVAGTFAKLRALRGAFTLGMDIREAIEEGRD